MSEIISSGTSIANPRKTFLLKGSEEEINLQFMSILDSIYDGLYITDGDAVTIMTNHAYEMISGLSAEDVLGKTMWDIVEAKLIDKSGTLAAMEKKRPVTIEQNFRTGKKALITSTPRFDAEGNLTMVITVVRDITELNALQTKYRETEERHRLEKDFIRRSRQFSSKLVACDSSTKAVVSRVEKVAPLPVTVLFTGETGVGKEQFAQLIYENSDRADQSFISVNCGAIPSSLIESELFGYERGAFTGANKEGKKGIFESADKGTVFLDEIGELPLEAQVHLLRILEDMKVKRVGGVRDIPVDVRIIAATNRNLAEMVKEKKFREDLYYRLNVIPITIPPLRERKDDIIPLAENFLAEINKKYCYRKRLTSAAVDVLLKYSWPGNVRELKNVVEQAVILSVQDEIYPTDLPIHKVDPTELAVGPDQDLGVINLKEKLARMEYEYICRAYGKHGTIRAAADSLCMDDATFVRKRKKYEACFKNE